MEAICLDLVTMLRCVQLCIDMPQGYIELFTTAKDHLQGINILQTMVAMCRFSYAREMDQLTSVTAHTFIRHSGGTSGTVFSCVRTGWTYLVPDSR